MTARAEERGAVRKIREVFVLLLSLLFAALTTGCAEEVEDLGKPGVADYEAERRALANRRKPNAPKKNQTGPKDNSSKVGASGSAYAAGDRDYFYDPRNKRDPFRSIRYVNANKEEKDFGPLGDFELEQLEISAVIWDAGNPRALILDPGGRSYIVQEGSAIGKNNGQVTHIGDNLILVKETYENFAGERTAKDVELRIRLSQGG
jgi:type IV pilus assembly protein PilP